MDNTFDFTLNNPMTKEDWDKLTDVELQDTRWITFITPSGREEKFISVKVLQEIKREIESKQSMDYQRNRKPYNKCLEIIDNHIKEIEHDRRND